MVVTTISCDAVILRCALCQAEIAVTSAAVGGDCQTCGGTLLLDRHCGVNFALRKDGLLIRCIAENKDGWHCEEDRGGRDFCPDHNHLADPSRVPQPTPQAVGDA